MKRKVVEVSNKSINDMSTFELSRWSALVEAVNLIADKAEERGLNINKVEIKPLAIQKYIESTCDIICGQLNNKKNKTNK